MPSAPTPQTERDFCSNCGFPVRGARCDACGAAQDAGHGGTHNLEDIPTRQGPARAYASLAEADASGLERALDAFRANDVPRFVEQVLAGEGGAPLRAAPTPEGPGWIAVVKGAHVFVTLRGDDVLLEAPVARLPSHAGGQRLPVMRLALELCAQGSTSSRVALRGDLLLLRSTPRLALLTPPVLRHFLREIAALAARYAGLLTVSLDALPAFADGSAAAGFEALGRTRRIQFAGGSIRRSIPPDGAPVHIAGPSKPLAPPPEATIANGSRRPGPRPLPRDEEPSTPGLGPGAPRADDEVVIPRAPAKPRIPAPHAPGDVEVVRSASDSAPPEPIPAILSPMFSEPKGSAPVTMGVAVTMGDPQRVPQTPPVTMGSPQTAVPVTTASAGAPRPAPPAPAATAPKPPTKPVADRGQTTQTGAIPEGARRPSAYETSVAGKPPSTRTEIEIETTTRRAAATTPDASKSKPDSATDLSSSDKLCMLLRHAQSLASLALEERPSTMPWLVRSTVFRAIYDFKDILPDAVAHLYRCTGVSRDGGGAPTRVSSAGMQATEPAMAVMDRVIVARGQVAKEKPLAIEPMTSAAQAKEHVARYLAEIDRAPGDPPLRHFLALGALAELLVRTKLPPQTDQRLRDIVAHAQREGAKGGAIDLMMTALQRINS